jgi:hypothetical membrane protein
MKKIQSRDEISNKKDNFTNATRMLLLCGSISGILFNITAWIQMATRTGFDIRRNAISQLSLGDSGWIQITNFILTGILAFLFAIGLRKVVRGGKGGTWISLLIGIYGIAMIASGIFHPDPGGGFPPGAPLSMPTHYSGHAIGHGISFIIVFTSLIAACFLFANRFGSTNNGRMRIYSLVTGILSPILVALGMAIASITGICFAIAAALALGWVSVVAIKLLTTYF